MSAITQISKILEASQGFMAVQNAQSYTYLSIPCGLLLYVVVTKDSFWRTYETRQSFGKRLKKTSGSAHLELKPHTAHHILHLVQAELNRYLTGHVLIVIQ